ncbi:hypothetical protein FDUTEX481_00840 [Tolypothrix sp. PCC 7601]|nr:hypothetical protein FDUTEX481_00840 [Tolypothrix sp. PCC 7601]
MPPSSPNTLQISILYLLVIWEKGNRKRGKGKFNTYPFSLSPLTELYCLISLIPSPIVGFNPQTGLKLFTLV